MDIKAQKTGHLVFLSLLATVPMYFRGLFFANDFWLFSTIALLGILYFITLSKTALRINSLTDLALGGMVICYILSAVFGAANTYTAIYEAVKYLLLFSIYLVIKGSISSQNYAKWFLRILVYALTVNALISLLTAAGIVQYPMAYSASEIEKWLNGTVQYHNAFGILMLGGYFVASSINTEAIKSPFFALTGFCSYFLMFGLIMSYSRGAWIFVPVLFVLLLVFATAQVKIRFFATGIASLCGVLCALPLFTKYVDLANRSMAILLLLAGLVISMCLHYAICTLFSKIGHTKAFRLTGILLIVLAVILVAAVVLFPGAFPFLPERLADRLAGISFQTNTAQERFVFYADAFQVYRNGNLLFGSGGGAWQFLYGMYQSYLYFSTQAHSYIMQVLVEAGALGFLCWIFSIVLFYIQCFKARKANRYGRDILCAVCCFGSAIILHSFIDFDLSIPAILLMLWCILGILNSDRPLSIPHILLNKWGSIAVCGILIIFSVISFIGTANAVKGQTYMTNGQNSAKAYPHFKTAATLLPINGEYTASFMVARLMAGETVTEDEANATLVGNSYNKSVHLSVAQYYHTVGNYIKAAEHMKEVIHLQPLNPANELSYILVSPQAIQQSIQQGNIETAIAIAEYVVSIEASIEAAEIDGENSANETEAALQAVSYARTIISAMKG